MERKNKCRREHVATFSDSIGVSLFKSALDDAITIMSAKYPGIDLDKVRLECEYDEEYNECQLSITGCSLETDEEYSNRLVKECEHNSIVTDLKFREIKLFLDEHPEFRNELLKLC